MRKGAIAAAVCLLWATCVHAGPLAYVVNSNLFGGGSESISVIDTATDTVTATIPLSTAIPHSIVLSPDARTIYVGSLTGGPVSVVDAATNTEVTTINIFGGAAGMAVTPNGARIYAAGGSTAVKVIDALTNAFSTFIFSSGVIDLPFGIAMAPDGARAYVTNQGSYLVAVIDTASNTVITSIADGNRGIAVHPDGTRVYAGMDVPPQHVTVIDTATDTVLKTLTLNSDPRAMAFHPDGNRLYVSLSEGLAVIDTTTDTVVAENDLLPGRIEGLSIHPDGDRVYLVNVDLDQVLVVDPDTLTLMHTINVGRNPISHGSFIAPNAVCGDGTLTFPEECDDGNTDPGDCCSPTCEQQTSGPCEDGDACTTGDTCDSTGTCVGGPPPDCDDHDLCTQDSCDPITGCVNDASPRICRTAGKSLLLWKHAADDSKDKLVWKWIKGQATDPSELGDPTQSTSFGLCLYAGSTAAAITGLEVGPDSAWSPIGKGFKYNDNGGTAQGIQKMILKGGDEGKAKMLVKGKGSGLPDFDLSTLQPPVTVQLVNSDTNDTGVCWESTYLSDDVIKNEANQFKGKAQP